MARNNEQKNSKIKSDLEKNYLNFDLENLESLIEERKNKIL